MQLKGVCGGTYLKPQLSLPFSAREKDINFFFKKNNVIYMISSYGAETFRRKIKELFAELSLSSLDSTRIEIG